MQQHLGASSPSAAEVPKPFNCKTLGRNSQGTSAPITVNDVPVVEKGGIKDLTLLSHRISRKRAILVPGADHR